MKKRGDNNPSLKQITETPSAKARGGARSLTSALPARKSADEAPAGVKPAPVKSAVAPAMVKSAVTKSAAKSVAKPPPIAGIGASAGGLEAFTQLLRALPADTGMAFVLVQHLEPKHESMLTKLLARATRMPVHEVREGMRAEPNHVYVIPANADLSLMDGLLHIVGRRAPAGRHLPIDYFLRSLAEFLGPQAIGVILSGTASDGTEGLKAIKVAGGITFAQTPESARFDGMPRSAIGAGCVDLVLPPEAIALELARIARHPSVAQKPPEADPVLAANEEDWTRLLRLLRSASGVDFTFYKKSTIKRRLARRMALHKIVRMAAYLRFMEGNRAEIDALFQEILIHVTSFFREPGAFLALQEKIIPQLVASKHAREPIRVWVPGCSTGEEAYSIAICLLERLGDQAADKRIQIFGTDISDSAIDKARAGVYPEDALHEVLPQRVHSFFTRVDGNYEVNQAVRELCVFARHDVTKDPPFSKLDLISCRNVLIYFEPTLQKKVLASFHYALKNHGVLLLGKSESLGSFTDLFTITDRTNKFFRKNTAARVPVEVFRGPYDTIAQRGKPTREAPLSLDLEKEADRIVWERYAHAGLVVNDDLEILHFRGDTSRYLKPVPGKATFNLLRMLREELVIESRAAIQEARKSGASVRREGIAVSGDHEAREVNVEVRPVPLPGGHERCFLILFEEAQRARRPPSRPAVGKGRAKESHSELVRLQNELTRTREYVQAVIGEQESTNEELKTANEEALSSMEELQSTNEELETAKEELQSSNEELVTLNEQLQNRNTELSRLTDDMSNILSGVDIPIVILDRERRIRRFTPPAQKLLGLLPGDIDRPIGNLRIGVNIPDLGELIAKVIEGSADVRREVQSEDGRWYLLSIRPFRTGEDKVEGVLMALVDIHELRQNQDALQKERSFISVILDAAKDLLMVVLDREGRIVQFNRAFHEVTGYSLEELKEKQMWDFLAVPEQVAAMKASFKELADATTRRHENYWLTKGGARRVIAWADSGVLGEDGTVQSVIAIGVDHTKCAEALERARESEATVQALLETAAQAIVMADQDGRITLANAATDKMFGYSRQELLGQPIEKLVPERLRKRHARHRENWFSQPRSRPMGAGLDLAGLRHDATEFPIEVSLSYLHSRQGTLGVTFISDITERRKNEETLFDYHKQLQRLAASLISAQETENREVARELHDVFSQELAALGMEVSMLLESTEAPNPLKQRLADLGKSIGRVADEIHCTARQLHPAILEELGLVAALREECDTFSRNSGIPVQFTPTDLPVALPEEVSLCLYRIAQESLRNIRKHAGATEVRVRLARTQGGVTLSFEDIGDGFDVEEARKRGGLGLVSMEERARLVNGKFSIRSQPGNGTLVEVFVPLAGC